MANQEHINILEQGVEAWNKWREENPEIRPDLSDAELEHTDLEEANLSKANLYGTALWEARLYNANLNGADLKYAFLLRVFAANADFTNADLRKANLREADLSGANLSGAKLRRVDLIEANLIHADLTRADLTGSALINATLIGANLSSAKLCRAALREASFNEANFSNANLNEADLWQANLNRANMYGANLSNARLDETTLVQTNFTKANLTGCSVYGISAWDIQLEETKQLDLVITRPDQPIITIDNLEVAQFVYLLLNNERIRYIIDTITSKVVLILGRFTSERKVVLNALRDDLRKRNYLPILFDFEKPANRDITETVSTLAHIARFVIVDITEPKSVPQELQTIVPHLPSVPIQPLLQVSNHEYGMFEHFMSYPWVQPVYRYCDAEDLLSAIQEHIINPSQKKVRELATEKVKRLEM